MWDGLSAPPWKTVSEPELRAFLIERAHEGYSFPINPVWPVRDAGWDDVLHALQQHAEGVANLRSWFPPASGVLERIAALHADHPRGFVVVKEEQPTLGRGPSFYKKMTDCDSREIVSFASLEVARETKARWRRIRVLLVQRMRQQGPK